MLIDHTTGKLTSFSSEKEMGRKKTECGEESGVESQQYTPRAIPPTIGVEINRWSSKKTKPRVFPRKFEIFDSRLSKKLGS